MSPFQIRTVMATAQKLRTMFFQSHICFIYINAYNSIRMILLNVCLKKLETQRYRAKSCTSFDERSHKHSFFNSVAIALMEYFLDENAPSRTLVVTNTNFLLEVLTYQILTNRALPSRICF